MATERASRAILALECLKKLMDLYQEYEEAPPAKKRKTYVKSEDIEARILKDVTWKHTATEDAFIPMTIDNFEDIFAKVNSIFFFIKIYYFINYLCTPFAVQVESKETQFEKAGNSI